MKVLIQWTLSTPGDWQEIDSSQWKSQPKKPLPTGGEAVDGATGWVTALNIQGIIFEGYDHYAVEDVPDGVQVTVWNDDPLDQPPKEFTAMVWAILTPAPDPEVGMNMNTRQSHVIYAGPKAHQRVRDLGRVQGRTLDTWSNFMPPPDGNTRHGIWLVDSLFVDHVRSRSEHGWREWGTDESYVKPPSNHTIAYFLLTVAGQTSHVPVNADQSARSIAIVAATQSATVTAATSNAVFSWMTVSGEPNSADWPNGTFRCELDVSAAGADLTYGFLTAGTTAGHFARATPTADLGTFTQAEAAFSGTGLKLATQTNDQPAGSANDRWECFLACNNAALHTNETLTLNLNSGTAFTDGPWPEFRAQGISYQDALFLG